MIRRAVRLVIIEPAGMGGKIPHGDGAILSKCMIRKILCKRCVKIDLSIQRQQRHAGSGKDFPRGGDVETGLRGHGDRPRLNTECDRFPVPVRADGCALDQTGVDLTLYFFKNRFVSHNLFSCKRMLSAVQGEGDPGAVFPMGGVDPVDHFQCLPGIIDVGDRLTVLVQRA